MPASPRRHLSLALPASVLLPVLAACSGHSTAGRQFPTATPTTSSPAPVVTTAPSTTPPLPKPTSPSPRAVDSPPPLGAPTCQAGTLTLADADTVVNQRSRVEVFVLRTHGPDCGLRGYPTITLRGADSKVLPVTYSQGGYGVPSGPAGPLSLSRSTSASFSIGSPRSGSCVDAATISVVLPGAGGTLTTSTTARICGRVAGVSAVGRLKAD